MNESMTDTTDDLATTTSPRTSSGLGAGAAGATGASTYGQAAATDGSTSRSAGLRDRVHRVAGKVHQAIDQLEQTLSSKREGVASAQSVYRERATQYGEQLRSQGDRVRDRVTATPMQAVGVATLVGFVFGKLFMRSPQVRVSRPVVEPPRADLRLESSFQSPRWPESPERHARRWMDAAGSSMRHLRSSSQDAAAVASANASERLQRARAMTAALAQAAADRASTLPLQLRLATERLRAGTRVYGSAAKSTVQAHPMIGLGTALGSVAVLATLWLKRRQASDTAYVAVDAKGHGVAWKHADEFDTGSGARNMIAARPMASAALALGIGAVVAAVLRRR
jgi:ElaB/YqjD/DUF883 family membrane-anchored ribosome-binding protein